MGLPDRRRESEPLVVSAVSDPHPTCPEDDVAKGRLGVKPSRQPISVASALALSAASAPKHFRNARCKMTAKRYKTRVVALSQAIERLERVKGL